MLLVLLVVVVLVEILVAWFETKVLVTDLGAIRTSFARGGSGDLEIVAHFEVRGDFKMMGDLEFIGVFEFTGDLEVIVGDLAINIGVFEIIVGDFAINIGDFEITMGLESIGDLLATLRSGDMTGDASLGPGIRGELYG